MDSTTNDNAVSITKNLIQTCRDGELGFKSAADLLDSGDSLKAEFLAYSAQRGDFRRQLEAAMSGMGEEASESGSVAGTLHRGWMSVRQTVSPIDRVAVLAECLRGEESAVKQYGEARSASLPQPLARLVQDQGNTVNYVLDQLRRQHAALERSANAA